MKKIKVFVGIPSTGSVAAAQEYTMRKYVKRYGDKIEFVYPELCVFRKFHDFARNAIVEEFMKTDCDVLFFLDSDVVPAPHFFDLVVEHYDAWKISGATYPVWMGNNLVFTAYGEGREGKGLQITEVPQAGTGFVKGLATGCLLIKREIFEKLEKPYFEFKYDSETRELVEGEDLGFCMKLNELGIEFFTDFSMVCKHYKEVDLLDLNNYAIEMANKKIVEYDADVRGKVQHLVQKIAQLQLELQKAKSGAPRQTPGGLILPGK